MSTIRVVRSRLHLEPTLVFFAIDYYLDERTGFPYAYRLYEPAGSPRTRNTDDEPPTQFVRDDEWEAMAEWCAARGIGPYERDYVETEIARDLAVELKMRWDNPDLKHEFECP
ncbi:hypothetical protein LNAOJCKE_0436 [Methylorubrum aminovorans]|uniref:Uncharacterized protein n=1 Tax=Methylorubrum aminovorans TaxID=269069 RepID=A0ABQ4U7S8_9HYPH|nr:hypothetical protein LNAOJCKE_0436 [Methylorubrum aminovorans]